MSAMTFLDRKKRLAHLVATAGIDAVCTAAGVKRSTIENYLRPSATNCLDMVKIVQVERKLLKR